MHLSLQIYHLVSPDGDIVLQGRAPKGIVREQFIEDVRFSDAGPQGFERGRKFRLALLINLRVRAYGESCHGKKCGLDKKEVDFGIRRYPVSSPHVLFLRINPRSCARHPGICSWRWP